VVGRRRRDRLRPQDARGTAGAAEARLPVEGGQTTSPSPQGGGPASRAGARFTRRGAGREFFQRKGPSAFGGRPSGFRVHLCGRNRCAASSQRVGSGG
jgi:hypothetical protein